MSKTKKEFECEVVNVNIAVPLPKPYFDFLQQLCKKLSVTVEYLLKDSVYDVLDNFFDGDYLHAWLNWYINKHLATLTEEQQEALQKSIDSVRDD